MRTWGGIVDYPLFFGHWATTADGWTTQIWGITPRGLIVRGLNDVLYTVAFGDLVKLTEGKANPPELAHRATHSMSPVWNSWVLRSR